MSPAESERRTPEQRLLWQCPLCSEQFTTPSGFEDHPCYNREEPLLPAFKCNLCPKKFTRAFNLRNHWRTHTDERPFTCWSCDRAFVRHNDCLSHELLHTGHKKFVCEGELASGQKWGCGRRFAQKKNLQRHFRSDKGSRCIQPLLDQENSQRQSALLAASALTGLGNSPSASEQNRQQPPEQHQSYHQPIILYDPPPWITNKGKQLSRPEHITPQLSATAPPTRDEALKAAETVRGYIRYHGRLNTEENGIHGYLELLFTPGSVAAPLSLPAPTYLPPPSASVRPVSFPETLGSWSRWDA